MIAYLWMMIIVSLVLSSSEILHFDSRGLGPKQWNQWWVLLILFAVFLCVVLTKLIGRCLWGGEMK